jgi:hypothetical protein
MRRARRAGVGSRRRKLKGTKSTSWRRRALVMPLRPVAHPQELRRFGLDIAEPKANARSRKGRSRRARPPSDFLKRQSPEFVDKVLGKRRAELFLAGKLTLTDLVSGTGRELTLEEL